MSRFETKASALEGTEQRFNRPPFGVIRDRRFGRLVCDHNQSGVVG